MYLRRFGDFKVWSLYPYRRYSNEYRAYKYYKRDNHQLFKQLIDDYMIDIIIDDFFLLPVSNSKHIDYLIRLIANKFNMPYYYAFNYVKSVRKNCLLDINQRYANLSNALVVNNLPDYDYYVLFDDIITSGATINEMRRALIDYGVPAYKICGLTIFNAAY